MFNLNVKLFTYTILGFHIFITGHAFYSLFSDYISFNLMHLHPLMLLLFTLAWVGITLGKRWCAFAYFSLLFYELAMKLFFGNYLFGKVFGDVMFPYDLLFGMVILVLYKQLFIRQDDTKVA